MPLSTIFGLVASSQIAVVLVMILTRTRRRAPVVRVVVWMVLSALTMVPIDGLVIAGYVRGVIGDPSMATVVLIAAAGFTELRDRELFDGRDAAVVLVCVLIAGGLLYPLALGLTLYDPYALGYGSRVFWCILLLVALAGWALEAPVVSIVITLGVAAYLGGLYESRNLWDYLIDPVAVIIAIVWGIQEFVRASARRHTPAGRGKTA